jgi:drug/metabolite transporter (DMT)-like permease
VGALFGLLSAVSIGLSDLFARRVVRDESALTAAVAISVAATVASAVAVVLFGSTMQGTDLLLGLASGVLLGVGLVAYYFGIDRSSATVVAPLVAAISAVIPYGYALTTGASPSGVAILGAAIALGGIVVITLGAGRAVGIRNGLIWGTISGIAYGVGFAIVLETSTGSGALPAVGQRVAASSVVTALAMHRSAQLLPPMGARVAGALGGGFAGLATVLYLAGARYDATAAVITTSMFPAATVAVGRVFFHDQLTRWQVIGIGIVLAGTVGVVSG